MEKKEDEQKKVKNVLENGTYSIYGPDSGNIVFDRIELHGDTGVKRIWKVASFSSEEIILKIEKFG